MKIYSAIFNKSFPLHESRFLKRQPWLTSSCTKAKLFAKKLNKPTFENIEKYKSVNNTFNTLKRKMKASYYRQILEVEEHKHDSKKCWSILKQAIGKLSNKSSFPSEILINNIPVSDKKEIAESFNMFANIGTRTSHNVPPSNKCFSSFVTQPLCNSIFIQYVSPQDIVDISDTIKPKSSSGQDEISTKLMKATITHIINPITHIINQSLQTGIVPNKMKIAKVVPIFKSNQSLIDQLAFCQYFQRY